MPKSRDTELLEQDEEKVSAVPSKEPLLFGRFSRRSFLTQLGAASIAATTAPLAHATAAVPLPQKHCRTSLPYPELFP